MRHLGPTRLLVVALAAGSLMAIPLATPASAAKLASCAGAKINKAKGVNQTGTFLKCTNLPATGGKGTFATNFASTTAIKTTIKWNKTGTTTSLSKLTTGKKPNKCGTGTQLIISGKVTGGSGKALQLIPKGSPFLMLVCLSPQLQGSLYPGSKIVI